MSELCVCVCACMHVCVCVCMCVWYVKHVECVLCDVCVCTSCTVCLAQFVSNYLFILFNVKAFGISHLSFTPPPLSLSLPPLPLSVGSKTFREAHSASQTLWADIRYVIAFCSPSSLRAIFFTCVLDPL